jgi:hypothetical protein
LLKIRKEEIKIFLILSLSIFFFLIPSKRDFSQCGDANEWIWLSTKNWLHGSEMLSNFVHYIFVKLMSFYHISPGNSFGYVSSLFGILYLFSLYFLAKTLFLEPFRISLFFSLSLTISSTGFFFQYPENTFLALPFLIFALSYSIIYLKEKEKTLKYLFLFSLFFTIACLFHGFSLFSFPFFTVLSFLKEKPKKAILHFLLFLLLFFSIIFLTWLFLKFSGFLFHPHHARFFLGGTYPFVDSLEQKIFFDLKISFFSKIHLISILFPILLSFPLTILIVPFSIRIKNLSMIELTLLLFTVPQIIFVVFWNPGLGIWRDIDLFLTPSFFISLPYVHFASEFVAKNRRFILIFIFLASTFSGITYIIFR